MSKSKDIAGISNQEMTREEALSVINAVEEELSDRGDAEMEYKLDRALCVLGVYEQPDPITGLVPCGCGGVVEQTDFHDSFFPYSKVECLECGNEIMRAGYTVSEAHSEAKGAWNTSHGYAAKRGPWVKTADRLPEDQETLNGCVLIMDERGYGSVQKRQVLERYPRDYPWWMPIPPLPEMEK